MKEEDLPDMVRWKRGFERGAAKLEEIRRKEIRASNTVKAIPRFDGLFEMAIRNPFPKKTYPLSKATRIYLGIDKK
ncbi:MAG: hypothetical protein AB7J13_08365 [Pyrinomonadaceae bacterium]